jgi:hypothetical protein
MSHSSSCTMHKGYSIQLGALFIEPIFDRLQGCTGQWDIIPLLLAIDIGSIGRMERTQIHILYGQKREILCSAVYNFMEGKRR